jgi:FkbH-like protein
MINLHEDLAWLPRAPEDFGVNLRLAKTGYDLRVLAGIALNENQLQKLANQLRRLQTAQADLNELTPLTIGILSNATTQTITPALIGTALRFGLLLDIVEAEFDQIAQEAFSADSAFASRPLHAILVSLDHRGLPFKPCPGDHQTAQQMVTDCVAYIKSIVGAVQAKSGARVILQNIVAPAGHDLLGSFEGRLPGTVSWIISRINIELDDLASNNCLILDVVGLAGTVGIENWHDPTLWNMAKMPFAQRYLPIYAEYVCRILAATQGKSRRCLILDLDNTLWGGVIGDDGVEGILIGNGDPTGEAHLELQQTILALRARGIVLAVSSKNDEAVARVPFQQHPDMLLKESDISVFQANWQDKASNIQAIAQALSLGLESMVFLDDNPAERLQVRQALPQVAVPELPTDPAFYAQTLVAAGYFEALGFFEEDKKRADFYQGNAKRAQVLSQTTDMNAYLDSLMMQITLAPFDAVGRARIVQLISKSNQFNLTTKRYSDHEVQALEVDNGVFTRQVRLKDTFGDNGMISVVICKMLAQVWEIDTWLMSCRVLGRRVEEAVLQEIITHALAAGAKKLRGVYLPTGRNTIVKQHYQKLGFTKVHESSDAEQWELTIADYASKTLPMQFIYPT